MISGLSRIIAHRGASLVAPENTLAAIRLAKELGAQWVEFDVMLTRDHHPIIMHDEKLNRTTNGRGRVSNTSANVIQTLDAGRWFSDEFMGESVPSFVEMLLCCAELGLGMNIELKASPFNAKLLAQQVVVALACHWRADLPMPLISSASKHCLQEIYLRAPQYPLGLISDFWKSNIHHTLEKLHCVSLHINHKRLTPERCEHIKKQGYFLLAYTVNKKLHAQELFGWGVDAVFTDDPLLLGD